MYNMYMYIYVINCQLYTLWFDNVYVRIYIYYIIMIIMIILTAPITLVHTLEMFFFNIAL